MLLPLKKVSWKWTSRPAQVPGTAAQRLKGTQAFNDSQQMEFQRPPIQTWIQHPTPVASLRSQCGSLCTLLRMPTTPGDS